MVERFKDTGHPEEYQCFESWDAEKEELQRHLTLQHGCFEHGALIPYHSFCKSVQYLRSIYTNWCEQYGLTEEEKGEEKLKESVIKDVLTCVKLADMSYKTRPDEDDGVGQLIPKCREYTLSRAHPQS